jgi:hypothetical protein
MNKIALFEGYRDAPQPIPIQQTIQHGSHSAPLQIIKEFVYQSYFDSTLLGTAILEAPGGQPIIPSTLATENIAGYAFGLHPASETPVAVQFLLGGANPAGAQPLIVNPGQIVRPFGDAPFVGIKWGLPLGWLGGGLALGLIYTSEGAVSEWSGGRPEIPFHRQRIMIQNNNVNLETVGLGIWPTHFPYVGSYYATALQGSSPLIAVEPTRTKLRFRLNTLATAADFRALLLGTNHFDLLPTGILNPGDVTAFDMTCPTTALVGTHTSNQFPTIEFTSGPLVRLGCEQAVASYSGIVLVASAASNGLEGVYVDVIRYGRL